MDVLLMSGGLDSLSAALSFFDSNTLSGADVCLLHINYGQRAFEAESNAVSKLPDEFMRHYTGIRQIIPQTVDLRDVFLSVGYTGSEEFALDLDLDDADACRSSARASWVPNRNGILVSVAAGITDSAGGGRIVMGLNVEEGATFLDNTLEFVHRTNKALELSCVSRVQLVAPLLNTSPAPSKTDMVTKLLHHKVGKKLLHSVMSCYLPDKKRDLFFNCGRCESCLRLRRAVEENPSITLLETPFFVGDSDWSAT